VKIRHSFMSGIPMAEVVPLTAATSTILRCGCGNIDRLVDPLDGWTCCICGRSLPDRHGAFAGLGRKATYMDRYNRRKRHV